MPDAAVMVERPAGLVALWRMEEGAGSAVKDSSPNANQGTLMKPTGNDWIAGHSGTALSLTGANWVSTAPSASFDGLTSTVTLAAWAWFTQKTTTTQVILARQRGTGSGNAFSLAFRDDGMHCTVEDMGIDPPSPDVPLGKWVHVACTYDGTRSIIYVDGKEVARQTVAAKIAMTGRGVTIGADINGSDRTVGARFFLGRLDEVSIYDRALPAAEIAALAK
jgi:hypothetical protein